MILVFPEPLFLGSPTSLLRGFLFSGFCMIPGQSKSLLYSDSSVLFMDKPTAMVLGSFIGDSLALGAHWIYDAKEIRKMGVIDSLRSPPANSYHKTKSKGDFTHYGDQTLTLLRSIQENHGFDLDQFAAAWKKMFERYIGYIDNATKDTLENFRKGMGPLDSGSNSADFSAVGRIAPILYYHHVDIDRAVEAAVAQARMTHNNEYVLEAASFFTQAVVRILSGKRPIEALRRSAEDSHSSIKEWVEEGITSVDGDSVEIVNELGSSCSIAGALPSTIHLIAKYEDDLVEALIQNTMAGGDSAARGMVIGMVLGAHCGDIPDVWLNDLVAKREIERLLG